MKLTDILNQNRKKTIKRLKTHLSKLQLERKILEQQMENDYIRAEIELNQPCSTWKCLDKDK